MTEVYFMQLLVLALMLMMAGKNSDIKQLQPIFKGLGGGQAADAFRQAEELSGMLSAVQSLASMTAPQKSAQEPCGEGGGAEEFSSDGGGCCGNGYPLSPIANIADERITYCLSRY
ncbi:MAG: hypothetical protein K2L72_02605, partial [Clostridia bacterium]|nr:hypothetical protein [Clostridia bacterium]